MSQPTFFFDRCFGQRLPQLVNSASPPFAVEWHDSRTSGFAQNTTDDEWLSVVGSRGWVVLSHDKRFHGESAALEAVRQHNIACFYLGGGSVPVWFKFVIFARAYKSMMSRIQHEKAPYIFKVGDNGHIYRVKGI